MTEDNVYFRFHWQFSSFSSIRVFCRWFWNLFHSDDEYTLW